MTWRAFALTTLVVASSLATSPEAFGEAKLAVKPLAEKKIAKLPPGPLFWRVESFATKAEADRAAGPLSLSAEAAGKAWLFTLGPAGAAASSGGTKVAEVGPLPAVEAPEYLLRINYATGVPGSTTPVHTHPGSEAFYVLAGEQSIRGPQGVARAKPGQPVIGGGGDSMPMQVSSSGTADLQALVMFVVDATKPFSSPATFR
jgi:hypothetical protein